MRHHGCNGLGIGDTKMSTPRWPYGGAMSLLPSTERLLSAQIARDQVAGRVPGLVGGIIRDGGLAWSRSAGDVHQPHDDVQFRLGSITKTVTAIAVLRLRDEGLIGLDDELDRHVPGTPVGRLTIGQLLAHLSGLTSETPGEPWWERAPGGPLEDLGLQDGSTVLPAGRRFHYSNSGFGLLGEVVARVRGRSWLEVVTSEVLLPLEMSRTTPRPQQPAAQGYAVHPWADVVQPEPEHDGGVMAPAGQLWSTARDLARLGALLLGDGGDVLAADTLAEMATPISGEQAEAGWSSYGLGVQVMRFEGATYVGHGGSMPGFLAGLWVDRAEHAGALTLANTTSGPDNRLVLRMLQTLRSSEPFIAEPWTPAAAPVPLDLLGPWYWGPSPVSLRAIAGGLLQLEGLGRRARSSRFRPHPAEPGAWLALDGYYAGETLRLSPTHLELATFIFTREPYDPAAPVPGGVDPEGWHV